MRRPHLALSAAFSLCVTVGATLASAQPLPVAKAAPLSVGAGQAARITLNAPVRDVVVGNPLVADVSLINERTLVVLGKKAGATSLLAFDARGQALTDRQIVVSAVPDQAVIVQRGVKASAYACGERCSSLAGEAAAADAPAPADK